MPCSSWRARPKPGQKPRCRLAAVEADARAAAKARHKAGADAFAVTVAPAIREAQAAGAKTLREIAPA
jgi:hypothetical protein